MKKEIFFGFVVLLLIAACQTDTYPTPPKSTEIQPVQELNPEFEKMMEEDYNPEFEKLLNEGHSAPPPVKCELNTHMLPVPFCCTDQETPYCCQELDEDDKCDPYECEYCFEDIEDTCTPPQINIDGECCLDENLNYICDSNEIQKTECRHLGTWTGRQQPRVPIGPDCCIDKDYNNICDFRELGEVECPQELYDNEYKFLNNANAWFENMIIDDDYKTDQGYCVRCKQGSEVGENTEYKYCDEFLYGPVTDSYGNIVADKIEVHLTLKETKLEENPGTTTGSFTQKNCESVKDVKGTWVWHEIIELKCYAWEYKYTGWCGDGTCSRRYEDCNNCKSDCTCSIGGGGNTLPRGGCAYGRCYSNGICCPTYAQYACNGKCYYTQADAISAGGSACSSHRIIC